LQSVFTWMKLLAADPDPDDPSLFTIDCIEAEIARRPLIRLQFPPRLEARYETDTRRARSWNICLTISIGLFAYVLYTLMDPSILPDLGWVPAACRIGIVPPVGLFAMWMCNWASARLREAFISVGMTLAMMIPVGFILVSRAPLAPYTMLAVVLVSMFGNITMRLRFHWACIFSAVTVLSVSILLVCRPDLPSGIIAILGISTLTCVCFGLVANNQMERAERLSYLHTLLEAVRVAQLSIDNKIFSALSLVDPLTGLANRRAFDLRLAELMRHYTASGAPFALLLADVDHFKSYNDHFGHPAGDACLVRVGQLLRDAACRQQDLVARYGGEEFAVVLGGCTAHDAARIGQAICTAVTAAAIPHASRPDGYAVVSLSIGITACDGPGSPCTIEGIIAAADRNLYAAKRAGRNRTHAG
jgi:diguanylate cyclase (GGDEF)-like protein